MAYQFKHDDSDADVEAALEVVQDGDTFEDFLCNLRNPDHFTTTEAEDNQRILDAWAVITRRAGMSVPKYETRFSVYALYRDTQQFERDHDASNDHSTVQDGFSNYQNAANYGAYLERSTHPDRITIRRHYVQVKR